MDAVIISRIAQETAIPESSVLATVTLFEKGATGPFIVRYRKEANGGLDETKVRLIQERMDYYREVRDKRAALLKSLSEQGKLTDEIKARIENCLTKVELDDLHHLFRSKKKTRSAEAIKKGLEPLAEYFWNQESDAWSVEEHIKVFVEASKELSAPEEALQGTVDIIAEWIGANFEYRRTLREMLEKDGFVISKVVPAKVNQKTKYNMYYDRRESVTTIPSHRVLAIRRGCKEGILISSIEGDHPKALEYLISSVIKDKESIFAPVLEAAVRESYNRILKPLIETEVRTQLKEKADREAIRVFQENLSNLLLSPPAGPLVVMGVDWGKDEECSVGVVNETGGFLEKAKIRFTESSKARRAGNGKKSSVKTETQVAEQKTDSQKPSDSTETGKLTSDPSNAGKSADPTSSSTAQESPFGSDTKSANPPTGDHPVDNADADSVSMETPLELKAEPEKTEPESPVVDKPEATDSAPPATLSVAQKESDQTGASDIGASVTDSPEAPEDSAQSTAEAVQESQPEGSAAGEIVPTVDQQNAANPEEPASEQQQSSLTKTEKTSGTDISESISAPEETAVQPKAPEASTELSNAEPTKESAPDIKSEPETASTQEKAMLTDTPAIEPLAVSAVEEAVAPTTGTPVKTDMSVKTDAATGDELEFQKASKILKELITRHKVRALSIGAGTRARELEAALRRIIAEENLGDILIAAVNDAGIAIYSSSRIAREEFPDWNPSARCAVSLARRLQDPLAELVKIDPKLIGVGQYQHDVDQKELHRKLLRTVQFCVNKVGVNVNTASDSLLRYISGLNDKIARRITAYRNNQGPFPSRESIPTAVGIETTAYEQAAGFLRIPESENGLDRTAVHPESYPIVQKMAAALEIGINELIGNREKVTSLKLEDFVTDTAGIPTLKDIREELLKPGRDPRKTFKLPKFRADVTNMSDLEIGMALEGTVTNVTNFGAFVDIGVRQDGLVHLSQMSNRFIRDPREAVKVGDIVQVKVISVEMEAKRIGLSIKALLPAANKKRRKQQRHSPRKSQSAKKPDGTTAEKKAGTTSSAPSDKNTTSRGRSKPNRSHTNSSRSRKKGDRKSERADEPKQKKESAPELPERSLQEKIEYLQSKFRGIN